MQTIYLDISNKGVIPCIRAKQSEVGRKFIVVITDSGLPYNIPDDSLLSVWYESDTDAGNYSSINEKSAFSIDGNKVIVELVAQMLLKPGDGEMCLSITHGDGGETNTWNIPYCVEYKPGAGSAVPTEYYTALTEAGAVAAQHATSARNDAEIAKSYGSDFLNLIFPVGYTFYWSPVSGASTDLSTAEKVSDHFGIGEWEQVKDTFIMAAGDKYAPDSVGGEENHTLTIEEMPQHTHRTYYSSYSEENDWGFSFSENGGQSAAYDLPSGTGVLFAGGGQPFSILPKYRAMYVWKRIA